MLFSVQQIIRKRSRLKVFSQHKLNGIFRVESTTGALHLGPEFGRVIVEGMTYEEAEQAISNMLHDKFDERPRSVMVPFLGVLPSFHFPPQPVLVADPPG